MRYRFSLLILSLLLSAFSCTRQSSGITSGEVTIVLTPVFEEQSSSTSSASRATATAFEEGDQIGLFALAKGAALMASG
ncbi:MAG: hypothetical protein RSA26_06850, partial [Mucinivorans sp.]